jgi:hypothetical protein
VWNLLHSDKTCKYQNSGRATIFRQRNSKEGLTFGPMIGFSITTMLQLTRHSLSNSLWPKNDYWNGTPTLFLWFGSKWLLAISKNKIRLKRTKISGYQRHTKNVMTALKDILQQEFQVCFKQWQHHWANCISAKWEYFEGDPSQYAIITQVCLQ